MASIYDKYGGEGFWEDVLDAFYEKNLSDSTLANFFAGKDVNRIKLMNRGLLAAAFNPAADHFSISVKRVHTAFSVSEMAFDGFVRNLNIVLSNFKVQDEDIEEILIVVNSFKEDVVHH